MRKSLYFLGILNDSDIGWLVSAGSRREIAAGSRLIEEGRPIDTVYLVIGGDQASPSATVQALEPSFVLEIPWRRLNAKLAEDTGFAARFFRALSMFLAARLRAANAALAGGPAEDAEGEMDFNTLGKIARAGARFEWIQKRLMPHERTHRATAGDIKTL